MVKSLTSVLDILPTRQPLAGSSCTLRRSCAAAGEVINLIIACAASRSFETVSRPTLFGQGMFTYPGTGPTKSVPGAPHHDVALLNAEFEVAARQEKGDRTGAATGENDLWLQLLGQAEHRDSLLDMLAAAAARIADRLRR